MNYHRYKPLRFAKTRPVAMMGVAAAMGRFFKNTTNRSLRTEIAKISQEDTFSANRRDSNHRK